MERNQELKHDGGKVRMELPPLSSEMSIAKVMTFAIEVEGYTEGSWRSVDMERYIGALKRHLHEMRKNPASRDEKSGLLHSEHALCNMAFINDMCLGLAISESLKYSPYTAKEFEV